MSSLKSREGTAVLEGQQNTEPIHAEALETFPIEGVSEKCAFEHDEGDTEFIDDYVAKFKGYPDFFALQQYDGTMMVLKALEGGAKTAQDVRNFLASTEYRGIAMSYKSDGKGNMAHSAAIVCFDGASRSPKLDRRYDNVAAAK